MSSSSKMPEKLCEVLSDPEMVTLDKISRSTVALCSRLYEDAAAHLQPRLDAKRAAPQPREPIQTLDEFRYTELPRLLEARTKTLADSKQATPKLCITLAELERLVQWKIHRGSYRPTLPGLVKSNTEAAVVDASHKAFAVFETPSKVTKHKNGDSEPLTLALKALCELRGVGPATASLILSVHQPKDVAFLADNVFAWFFGAKPAKYDVKEVQKLHAAEIALLKRLNRDVDGTAIGSSDLERAVALITWQQSGRLTNWMNAAEPREEAKDKAAAVDKGRQKRMGDQLSSASGKRRSARSLRSQV